MPQEEDNRSTIGAFDSVVSALADASIAEELKRADTARKIIQAISDVLRVRPIFVRAVYHWLLVRVVEALEKKAQKAVLHYATKSAMWSVQLLRFVPKLSEIHTKFVELSEAISKEHDKQAGLRSYLDGRISLPTDINYSGLEEEATFRTLDLLRDLSSETETNFDDLRQQLMGISELLQKQPPLDLTPAPFEHSQRFVFRLRVDSFHGRQHELDLLDSFLGPTPRLSWQLITGEGGMGKSRIAFELCLANGGFWRAGFLPEGHGFSDWHDWQPIAPTLIVIDYVATRAREAGDIISALNIRQATLEWPVRILLLEREINGSWWNEFCGKRSREATHIGPSKFSEPHTMPPLMEDDIWQIIKGRLDQTESARNVKKSTILEIFQAIDKKRRPLYAVFLADALAAGRDPRSWDAKALVSDVLDREERDFWIGARDIDKTLLCVATMCGGVDVEKLMFLETKGLLPKSDQYNANVMTRMSGGNTKQKVQRLEPDILGELFVLQNIEPDSAADDRGERLVSIAWLLDPVPVSDFRSRAFSDFSTHVALSLFQKTPRKIGSEIATALIRFVAERQSDFLNHLRRELRYRGEAFLKGVLLASYNELIERSAEHQIPIDILLIQRGSEFRRLGDLRSALLDLSHVASSERGRLWRYEQGYVWFLQGTPSSLEQAEQLLCPDLQEALTQSNLANRGLYAKVLERQGKLEEAASMLEELYASVEDYEDPDARRWAFANIPAHCHEVAAARVAHGRLSHDDLEGWHETLKQLPGTGDHSWLAYNLALQAAAVADADDVEKWSQERINALPHQVTSLGEQEATYYALLGAAHEVLGKYQEAREAYQHICTLPVDLDNQRGIVWARQRLRELDNIAEPALLPELVRHLFPIISGSQLTEESLDEPAC